MKKIWLSLICFSLSSIAMQRFLITDEEFNKKTLQEMRHKIESQKVSTEMLLQSIKASYYANDQLTFKYILNLVPDEYLLTVRALIGLMSRDLRCERVFGTQEEYFFIRPQFSPDKSKYFERFVYDRMRQSLEKFHKDNPPTN